MTKKWITYLISGEPMWSFSNMLYRGIVWQRGSSQTLASSSHWCVGYKSSTICFITDQWSFWCPVDSFYKFSWQIIHVWTCSDLFSRGCFQFDVLGPTIEIFKSQLAFLPRRKYFVTFGPGPPWFQEIKMCRKFI